MNAEFKAIEDTRREQCLARIQAEWTPKELEILRTNFPVLPMPELSRLLPGRAAWKIADTAKRLGLKRIRAGHGPYKAWTADEERTIVENAASMTAYGLVGLLPDRTESAIRHRAKMLGVKTRDM